MKSKFTSTCKVCKKEIKTGDTIHKINDHWCSNSNCGKDNSTAKSITTSKPYYQQLHTEIWNYALSQVNTIYPSDSDKTSKMILAQVFYKKCMDCEIHGKYQDD